MSFSTKSKFFYGDFFDAQSLIYYRKNIVAFVEDFIFHKDFIDNGGDLFLSDQQKEILLSIQNNKRVSVKSGRGIGKTAAIAFACIWWLCMYPEHNKFVCTAPSFKTLKSGLWNEICMWFEKSLVAPIFTIGAEKIFLTEKKNSCYAEPRTAREKESMSGIHADHLLIICDEASGTEDDILRTLDATLTSGSLNKICLITNPTRTSGFFFDTFEKDTRRWVTHTYSSADSPFVDKEHVQSYLEKYGEKHPLYLVDVLGEFPPQDTESFISYAEIKAAMDRNVVPVGRVEIGVDVARYGDDLTVIYWRHGYKVYPAKTLEKSSIVEVADLVLKTVIEARATTGCEEKIHVKVDDSGVGGGVTDILMTDRLHNLEIVPCNFGGKGDLVYANEASAMWGTLKDNINYVDLPNDNKLREELAARRFKLSDSGKIQIESKSIYKRDFKSSPDRADALVLCFFSKQPERRVLNRFDSIDPDIIKPNFSYTGEDRFCSIFYTNDLVASIVYAAWNGRDIFVYDEHVGDEPMMYLAYMIREHGDMSRIIGSQNMFGKTGEDVASKMRKFKVNVTENVTYNELGAIEMLSVITAQKRLKILDKCTKTIDQMNKWKIDLKRSEQERQFGLCFSLSNIVSFLKRKIEHRQENINFRPYSDEKQEAIKSIERHQDVKNNLWMYI